MSDDMISVPRVQLQDIFDVAVSSMDFGSGFWGTEQTEAARAIAVLLGVAPMEGTPRPMRRNYPHPWDDGGESRYYAYIAGDHTTSHPLEPKRVCRVCNMLREHQVHGQEPAA